MTGKHEKEEQAADSGLLTRDEQAAIQMVGALHELIATRIIADGPAKWGDHAELTSAIHIIQHMIMAQAAARAYPEWFRLLGEGFVAEEGGPEQEEVDAEVKKMFETLNDDAT